jgi:hypothetical protein
VLVVSLIVPAVPLLQQHVTVPHHLSQIQPLRAQAAGALAQRAQLGGQRHNIHKGVVICFEEVSGIVVLHCILQYLQEAGRYNKGDF